MELSHLHHLAVEVSKERIPAVNGSDQSSISDSMEENIYRSFLQASQWQTQIFSVISTLRKRQINHLLTVAREIF